MFVQESSLHSIGTVITTYVFVFAYVRVFLRSREDNHTLVSLLNSRIFKLVEEAVCFNLFNSRLMNVILGSLSKSRRRRQRERQKKKGLMSRTIAVHVHYKSFYISMPSSEEQQREMTKFCVVYGTWTTTANFSYFYLELNAVFAYLA